MNLLLFVFLAGYAVKCDESNYYVIEMPAEDTPIAQPKDRKLQVYWNVPTMQCSSKKIPFDNLDQFGIIQNSNDRFRGEKITILYDPGFFPALLRNDTSGMLRFRNGGVPQEGDLKLHLNSFRSSLNLNIPDQNFSGIGIIDFESWRPIFRQNFGDVWPYKSVSYKIEQNNHFWWPDKWIKDEAQRRFEEAARIFMQNTISVAKQMRPRARWGYYGFPYCFNMASNNMHETCADKVNGENDKIYWLWSESTALYPSVYSPKNMTASQLSKRIRGRVKEAARVRRRDTPILPYFWFRYQDGDYLSETDLHTALETFHQTEVSGFIIWGSSKDVNTFQKCQDLHKYIYTVFGPAISRYTKSIHKLESEYSSEVFLVNDDGIRTTTTTKDTDVTNDDIYNITTEVPTTEYVMTEATVLETSTYIETDSLTNYLTINSNESIPKQHSDIIHDNNTNNIVSNALYSADVTYDNEKKISTLELGTLNGIKYKKNTVITENNSENITTYNNAKHEDALKDSKDKAITEININQSNRRIQSLNNEFIDIVLNQMFNNIETQNKTALDETLRNQNAENITSIYNKLPTNTSVNLDDPTIDVFNINGLETTTVFDTEESIKSTIQEKQRSITENIHISTSGYVSTEIPIVDTSTHFETNLLMTILTKDIIKEQVTEGINKETTNNIVMNIPSLEVTEEIDSNHSETTTGTENLNHHIHQLNDDSRTETKTTENHLVTNLNHSITEVIENILGKKEMKGTPKETNDSTSTRNISKNITEYATTEVANNSDKKISFLEQFLNQFIKDASEDRTEQVAFVDVLSGTVDNLSRESTESSTYLETRYDEKFIYDKESKNDKPKLIAETTKMERNSTESYTTENHEIPTTASNQDTLFQEQIGGIHNLNHTIDDDKKYPSKYRRKNLLTLNEKEVTTQTATTEEYKQVVYTTDSLKNSTENAEVTIKNIVQDNNQERSTNEDLGLISVTSAPESLTSDTTTKQVDVHIV